MRTIAHTVTLCMSLCLLACGDAPTRTEIASAGRTVSTGTADLGGDFDLIRDDGQVVTQDILLGKPNLIYFGFSYCPDVCPTSLQRLGAAQEILGKRGDDIGYYLITVDPERDTPEALAQYVSADVFPDGLRGLTGSDAQVDKAKAAFKVASQKVELPESDVGYTVDHTDIIYLMDKTGTFVTYFAGSHAPQDIADRVGYHLKTGK